MTDNKFGNGKKKGGSRFPKIPLSKAVEFAKKLVSKTHIGPQPATIIFKGVFNCRGSMAQVRASALKQFDLLSGTEKALNATELACQINSAPPDEVTPLLQKACLMQELFKTLYDTFQGDTVSRAKLRQQALHLKVHPDLVSKCVEVFVESVLYAKLAKERNGEIEIFARNHAISTPEGRTTPLTEQTNESLNSFDEADLGDDSESEEDHEPEPAEELPHTATQLPQMVPKAQFQVALNLETMDPEKLEKHLKILKRYGVIG